MPNFALEVTKEERYVLEKLISGLLARQVEKGRDMKDPVFFMVLTGLRAKIRATEKEEVRIETPNSNPSKSDS